MSYDQWREDQRKDLANKQYVDTLNTWANGLPLGGASHTPALSSSPRYHIPKALEAQDDHGNRLPKIAVIGVGALLVLGAKWLADKQHTAQPMMAGNEITPTLLTNVCSCGAKNSPSYRFCIGCGAACSPQTTGTVPGVCTACGHRGESASRFCTSCGSQL